MSQKVVLLSTKRLQPDYFDTIRADLGGDAELVLDVVGWLPPIDVVDEKVNTFTLIGPGRMPTGDAEAAYDEFADDEEDADDDEFDESPDAVIAPESVSDPSSVTGQTLTPASAEQHAGQGAGEAADENSDPAPAVVPRKRPEPMPWGTARVQQAVRWRYRRARRTMGRAVMKVGPVKFVRTSRVSKNLSKAYWKRVQSRPDVREVLSHADVVIALDANAIWAGWHLGQERPDRPVVLGLPAARRELDQLKVPAGH
ncbi:hypothetical protein HPO96_32495 [Kribbella sandramycini]|uniref:Uncharacterized protein n=1 Tax=Kribbella sandramycini TaxID=60450 RepID=A0A7Y4L5X1_9ACTN|nr:hypothetical protein [Kribbella sandramycini]MBB6565977.1 hypothetical protein [Kribbella sandramycini]NOL44979.1 hypothetical protein [Kribbella sandramycini]